MQTLELRELTGPDGFTPGERPAPEAGEQAVLIEVKAAGVSFPDLLMSRGRYQVCPELPHVAGQEVAGVVLAAPPGGPLRPGERVWSAPGAGGFAEMVLADPACVFPLPEQMSFEEGAAIPSNFLTAMLALGRRGALKPGESLVVLGAAGGLGGACVAIGRALGARVIAVVSVPAKRKAAELAGAECVIVGASWREEVLALTDGHGANVIADLVGGEQTLTAVRSAAPEGRVLVLGFTSGAIPDIRTNRLLLRNVSLVGVGLGALNAAVPGTVAELGAALAPLLESGARPVIDRLYPLAKGADALRRMEAREVKGKLVLVP